MGNSCPKCSTAVDHDFGVFVCSKCGAVLFVDFDGKIQLSTPESHGSSPAAGSDSAENEPAPFEINEQLQEKNSAAEPADFEMIEESSENPMVFDNNSELASTSTYENADQEQVNPEVLQEEPVAENNDWADQSMDEQMSLAAAPRAQAPVTEVSFEDVVEYANQTELDNSPLVYTLWIQGIDRKETRDKVMEVLKDIKFNIHMKELVSSIKGGVLELRDLNPVKTSLIATRLREESVQFRWRQNVFQSEAASGT